jgi:hypothetical protein
MRTINMRMAIQGVKLGEECDGSIRGKPRYAHNVSDILLQPSRHTNQPLNYVTLFPPI